MPFDASSTEFISSLVGALVGATSAYILTAIHESNKKDEETKKSKLNLAFEFHREFTSPDFNQSRYIANELLVDARDATNKIGSNIDQLRDKHPADITHLFAIMRFFQRLSIAHKYAKIDKELLVDIFQEPFYYWYYNFFKTGFTGNNWRCVKNDLDKLAICYRTCLISKQQHSQYVLEAQESYTSYPAKGVASSPKAQISDSLTKISEQLNTIASNLNRS